MQHDLLKGEPFTFKSQHSSLDLSASKRQVMNHQKLIGFDQLHKDGYQRFFDKERKDIGVNILDS